MRAGLRRSWHRRTEPELVLRREIDPVAHSPLLQGLVLSMSYADAQGAIGLTRSGAMNRRFVHWAAGRFDWSGYSRDELLAMDKVLTEIDRPPLRPVRDLLLHLELLRRYRGTLRLTKRGRELMDRAGPIFDLAAPSISTATSTTIARRRGTASWTTGTSFSDVINIEARTGCTTAQLTETPYGRKEADRDDPEHRKTCFSPTSRVIRPLCWLGLLWKDRKGPGFLSTREPSARRRSGRRLWCSTPTPGPRHI